MNLKSAGVLLISLLTLILSTATAYGDGIERKVHNKNFVVDSRKVVIKGGDAATATMLSNKLKENGATITNDFISRLAGARITLQSTSKIGSKSKGYSIEVRPSKISIKYTSQEMLESAMKEFYELFSQSESYRVVKGCDIYCYGAVPIVNKFAVNSSGVIDGVTNELNNNDIQQEIKTRIQKQNNPDFILAIANRNVYRVNFKVLEGLNSSYQGIAEQWTYPPSEIKQYVIEARQSGGEFVPAIDFLSKNERFEEYTGHKIDSPEGMRFVRAIIEECADDWGIKKLCIGTKSKMTVEPYILEFLESVAKREQIELIVI